MDTLRQALAGRLTFLLRDFVKTSVEKPWVGRTDMRKRRERERGGGCFGRKMKCGNQSKDWVRPAALKWHVAGRVCKGRGITLVPWCIDVLGLLVEGC